MQEFPTSLGWIAKMKQNNCTMTIETENFFKKKIQEIRSLIIPDKVVFLKKENPENVYIAEIEEMLDNDDIESIKNFTSNDRVKSHLKSIHNYYAPILQELEDALRNKSEGYNLKSLPRRIELFKTIFQVEAPVKKVDGVKIRKVRAKKVIPAAKGILMVL
jgi:hypothetical protein